MVFGKKFIPILLAAVFVSGCGNTIFFKIGSQTQNFSQGSGTYDNKLDILWVVDNSGSMVPFQQNMATNFGSVISSIVAKGYDFNMAVVTSDAYIGDPTMIGYVPSLAPYALFRDGSGTTHSGVFVMTPSTPGLNSVFMTNVTQGAGGSGDERPFSSFRAALSNPANPPFLRHDAFLSIIILSDEDDFSGNNRAEYGNLDHDYTASTLDSIQTYVSYLDTLTGSTGNFRRYNVNTIAVTDNACLAQLQAAGNGSIVGQRYMDISAVTNGVVGSICDPSFSTTLNAIASQILTLSTQFFLVKVPQPGSIQIKVDNKTVVENPINGWTYNAVANSILFHGSAVPRQGAVISVTFTPVSI